MHSLSLYIHIPWCIKKCPYCDFNSHQLKTTQAPEKNYIKALLKDLQQDIAVTNTAISISSIFIGGGTPSLFSADAFERLLAGIDKLVALPANLEITLEANPSTFESKKFCRYKAIGINRLSIGIQSFNEQHLRQLGRIHSSKEALTAIKIAQAAGFDNVNLDLMFGLPNQSHAKMLADVKTAIAMQPDHISFYQLTLEPNTYFYKFPPKLPTNDYIFLGQKQCQKLLTEAGYKQYEISAYAKKNAKCQHNLNYWKFGDYLGIGAGAHGKLNLSMPANILRTIKLKVPESYVENVAARITKIPIDSLAVEYLMNNLRLKSGFNLSHYKTTTGLTTASLEPALSTCINLGLLIKQGEQILCSVKGWDFLDAVLEKFIP